MARRKLPNFVKLGSAGLYNDAFQTDIDLPAMYDARNVRFLNSWVEKTPGEVQIFGALPVVPHFVMPVRTASDETHLLVMGLAKGYAVEPDGTMTNITRQTASVDVNYTGTSTNFWTGGVLSGVPVVNNGVDDPQMWLPPEPATKLAAITGWPANTKARVLRPFKNWLVAANMTVSGTRYPYRIKWSAIADPGTIPTSWDEADPTKDAGERDLAQDSNEIVDMLPLGDINCIYRDGSMWVMQWIGGQEVFSTQSKFTTFGSLTRACIAALETEHVVLTAGDFLRHNGDSAKSLLRGKMQTWLQNNISDTNYQHSFVVPNYVSNEIWACFPELGAEYCTKALVWNWADDTLTIRDLPKVRYAAPYRPDLSQQISWGDEDVQTWDSEEEESWDSRSYSSTVRQLVMVTDDQKLIVSNAGETFNGTPFTAFFEKRGITWGDQDGNPDLTSLKTFHEALMRIEGTPGATLTIQIGTQDDLNDEPTWRKTKVWTIGETKKVDALISGRMFAIRVFSNTDMRWRISGLQVDMSLVGVKP